MKNKRVVAVVVTYNRKEDLISCIQAIFKQSKNVDALYIIDNKSTDGTPEHLIEHKIIKNLPYLDSNKDEIYTESKTLENGDQLELNYVRKFKNDGGAGGFYKGMKLAYESNCDWLWLMDDDGVTDNEQLHKLVTISELNGYDYVNALVIDKDNTNKLAFGLKGYENVNDISETETIEGFVNPFNGTLISKKVMDKIGLIKKEMFIWGDEREYTLRVAKNGFKLITILAAKHFHPKDKGSTTNVFPFTKKIKVILKPVHLEHIYFRNLGYLEKLYGNRKIRIMSQLSYIVYFALKFKFRRVVKFFKYYNKGLRQDFS